MDGWIAKSPDFFLSELGDAKLKQEEVDDHLEAEAHGGVRHKPGTTFHHRCNHCNPLHSS